MRHEHGARFAIDLGPGWEDIGSTTEWASTEAGEWDWAHLYSRNYETNVCNEAEGCGVQMGIRCASL